MYPKAKVVLTVRDPRKWYTSAHLLYDQLNGLVAHFPYSFFLRLVGLGNVVAYLRQEGSGTREGSIPETAEEIWWKYLPNIFIHKNRKLT